MTCCWCEGDTVKSSHSNSSGSGATLVEISGVICLCVSQKSNCVCLCVCLEQVWPWSWWMRSPALWRLGTATPTLSLPLWMPSTSIARSWKVRVMLQKHSIHVYTASLWNIHRGVQELRPQPSWLCLSCTFAPNNELKTQLHDNV